MSRLGSHPVGAVVGTADHAIRRHCGWPWLSRHSQITEVKAPHLSMISDPSVVTNVILQAVQAIT